MNFGLVNTHYAEIDGVGTVGSLDKLQFVPELVVIAAPATAVVGIIDEAGKGGSGRADYYRRPRPWRGLAGGRSRTRRAKIWNAVIGPNCLGIMMMPGVALNASFSVHMPGPANLALISQSGAIAAGEDASALSSHGHDGTRARSNLQGLLPHLRPRNPD